MNLCDADTLHALLRRHGIRLSKSRGQNFLIAPWVPPAIAEAAGLTPETGVLEIGPGAGALTAELSGRAARVVAVELDRALPPLLRETLAGRSNVEIVSGDILTMDLPALVANRFDGLRAAVCANLPYHITTPVLTALLEAHCFSSITVMVQREVAARIAAPPGRGDGGAFSVWVQYHAQPELLFDVPPTCFFPAPRVTSSILKLTPRAEAPVSVADEDFFFSVVRAAFALRRKTLVNSLCAGLNGRITRDEARACAAACGLAEDVRGERLTLEEFAALSEAVGRALAKHPE